MPARYTPTGRARSPRGGRGWTSSPVPAQDGDSASAPPGRAGGERPGRPARRWPATPGRASRSRRHRHGHGGGDADGERCGGARPSAPQSQPAEAEGQHAGDSPADDAGQERLRPSARMPRSRSETDVVTTASAMPRTMRPATPSTSGESHGAHSRSPRRRAAPAPHRRRPLRDGTASTSSPRGWKASAPVGVEHQRGGDGTVEGEPVGDAPAVEDVVAGAPQARRQLSGCSYRRIRRRRSGPRPRRRRRSRRHGERATSTARSPAAVGVEPERGPVAADAHAAEVPARRQRGDARHRRGRRDGLGHEDHHVVGAAVGGSPPIAGRAAGVSMPRRCSRPRAAATARTAKGAGRPAGAPALERRSAAGRAPGPGTGRAGRGRPASVTCGAASGWPRRGWRRTPRRSRRA